MPVRDRVSGRFLRTTINRLTGCGCRFLRLGNDAVRLCPIISSLGTLRVAPVVGGVLALAVDLLVHAEVFVAPQASTSGLLLIFVPLWNDLVLVPAGTIVAWLVLRTASGSSALGPRRV